MLACTSRTFVDDLFAHCFKQRQACLKIRFLAADHNGQCAVLRARIAAGNRRIEHMQAVCGASFRNPNGQLGIGRRHVDQICTRLCRGKNPLLPKIDLLDILRVAHHGDDRIPAGCAPRCRITPCYIVFRQKILQFGLGARIDRYLIARLEQIFHHRAPHNAHTNKPD